MGYFMQVIPVPFAKTLRASGSRGLVGLLGLFALAGGSAGAVACGPSFQAVYECDVHFEHCYAMDESDAPVDAKKECWRDWVHGFTYGQSRDRIEYGGTRLSQLSLGPSLPSEDVGGDGSRPRRTIAAPMPTNAFAPPPNVIEGHAAVERGDQPGHAPGADCADTCKQHWTACRVTCRDRACDACDQAYRECMPSCFREDGSRPSPPPPPAPPARSAR
jgi:hypothetical protein